MERLDENFWDTLKYNAKSFKRIQDLRVALTNVLWSEILKKYIKDSPLYPEIKKLARDKNKKKEWWALIVKALKEKGKTVKDLKEELKEAIKESPHIQEVMKAEAIARKILVKQVVEIPIYQEFLKNIKGLGAPSAGVLLSFIVDINRFPSIAKLRSYLGLGSPTQQKRRGQQCNYNPRYKAYMLGVIGLNFIRKKNEYYLKYFLPRREATKQTHPEWTPNHRKNDALRYMVKKFIADLWVEWKKLESPNNT